MNTAHWHLILNHFPIIGTLGGIVVLFYGLIRKSNDTKVLGALLILAMAIISVIVMETGEAAEELVEKIPGISEAAMEVHEDAAKIANGILIASGVLALISLVLHFFKKNAVTVAMSATLVLSSVAFGFMGYTGYLGGKIRHTEITTGNSIPANNSAATPETGDGDED
ncbi:MAG: hypothetical protein IPH78_01625 [Bacteroidetes bacterium]|nr:hypothetical protein [Bacteroidota bacterium]MBK8659502.1 hypothetical protein [Bacteroidota bacterium]